MSEEGVPLESKKRAREEEDPHGFESPAAKLAAKTGAKMTLLLGNTISVFIQELDKCKTLKQFKDARTFLQGASAVITMAAEKITVDMINERKQIEQSLVQSEVEHK
jgi:hypothetical protein